MTSGEAKQALPPFPVREVPPESEVVSDRALLEGDGLGEVGESLCVECEDQLASLFCVQCEESYCDPCFTQQHGKGKRASHNIQKLEVKPAELAESKVAARLVQALVLNPVEPTAMPPSASPLTAIVTATTATTATAGDVEIQAREGGTGGVGSRLVERSRNIPLRLTDNERDMLRIVEGALSVSE